MLPYVLLGKRGLFISGSNNSNNAKGTESFTCMWIIFLKNFDLFQQNEVAAALAEAG